MWVMFVGLLGAKPLAFSSFISASTEDFFDNTVSHNAYRSIDQSEVKVSNEIENDKRKRLHLFQCYIEANSDKIPERVSSIFSGGIIEFTAITLLPHHISSLIFFMSASVEQQWRVLELGNCNLRSIGMNNLLEHVIKNDKCISTLEYVDLSENYSAPWGVYCVIIRHCCVNSLTLCGDDGMEKYVEEIIDSLKSNRRLHSMTLCSIGRVAINLIKRVLDESRTLDEVNLSWRKIDNALIKEKKNILLSMRCSLTMTQVVKIKLLSDSVHEYSPSIMKLSYENIKDDAVLLIVLLMDTIISCFGTSPISVLQKVDLSHNEITNVGMIHLKVFKHCPLLKCFDLSGNKSSPWGVYCVIIRHCHVNSLTLCGDDGMEEYVKEITDSLEANGRLESLTLYSIGRNGVKSMKDVLIANTTLNEVVLSWEKLIIEEIDNKCNLILTTKYAVSTPYTISHNNRVVDVCILLHHEEFSNTLNLSKKKITDNEVEFLAFGLHYNTTLQMLDISYNSISDDGAVAISNCLKNNKCLQGLYMSHNKITIKGFEIILEVLQVSAVLNALDVSFCYIHDKDGTAFEFLKHNNYLNTLNVSHNRITVKGANKIAEVIKINTTLQNLNISYCGIPDDGVVIISDSLKNNTSLKHLYISHNNIAIKGANKISEVIQVNRTLQTLDISCCGIPGDRIAVISDCLKTNSSLKHFYMSRTNINNANKIGEILKANTTLLTLDISHCGILDDDVVVIIGYLKNNSNLKHLYMSYNNIAIKGANKIAEVIQFNTTLQILDISYCGISDDGAVVISEFCLNKTTKCSIVMEQ